MNANATRELLLKLRSGRGLKGELLRGAVGSILVKILAALASLGSAVVLARILGAEGFGIYSFIFALVSVLAIPAQLGLPNLVVRETANAHENGRWDLMKGIWRWASLLALVLSAVLTGLAAVVTWIWASSIDALELETLWWGLLLVPLIALGNLRGAALRGLRRVVQGQLPEFVIRPTALVLLVVSVSIFYNDSLTPPDAMMLHVFASTFAFLVGAILLFHARPQELKSTRAVIQSRLWLASAIPLALTGGMQVVNQNVGILILGSVRSPEEVGLFRVAAQLALTVSFGLSAANLVAAPHIARLYTRGDLKNLQKLLTQSARLTLILSFISIILIVFLGEYFIRIIFGVSFSSAFYPLVIISVGQIIKVFFTSAGVLLNMTGHEAIVSRSLVLCVFCNVILSLPLSAFYGVNGTAIAAAVSSSSCYIILWWCARQKLQLDTTPIGSRRATSGESGGEDQNRSHQNMGLK